MDIITFITPLHLLTYLGVGDGEKKSWSASWFLNKRYLDISQFLKLQVQMQFKNFDNSNS